MSDVVEYDQFQISLDATSSLNFTFQQNAVPLIRHISLTGSKQLSESKLVIESHPAFFNPLRFESVKVIKIKTSTSVILNLILISIFYFI